MSPKEARNKETPSLISYFRSHSAQCFNCMPQKLKELQHIIVWRKTAHLWKRANLSAHSELSRSYCSSTCTPYLYSLQILWRSRSRCRKLFIHYMCFYFPTSVITMTFISLVNDFLLKYVEIAPFLLLTVSNNYEDINILFAEKNYTNTRIT